MLQANKRCTGEAPRALASKISLLALMLTLVGGLPALADNGPTLQPFSARFKVEWHGFNAGTSTIELVPNGNGRYTYASRNQARGIFRLAFPDVIRQFSVLQIENGLVRPLEFRADDGSKDTSQDVALDFDWSKNRVTGIAEDHPVALDLKPGTQDAMSIQLALMLELQAGHTPKQYWMVDKTEIKDFLYEREGEATLSTPLGSLQTVIWSSRRPNSDRVIHVWYAPALGFVPVQATRTLGSKLE